MTAEDEEKAMTRQMMVFIFRVHIRRYYHQRDPTIQYKLHSLISRNSIYRMSGKTAAFCVHFSASVIEGTIFCAHAGLSPRLYDLDQVLRLLFKNRQ